MLHVSPTQGWWVRTRPFRHVHATNVLDADAYQRVASAFETVASATSGPNRLARSQPNYDALMLAISDSTAPLFAPFFSEPFLARLRQIFGIPHVPRVDGGLHSTPAGGRTGWIHTDLCSAWFDEPEERPGVQFPDRARCDYFSGAAKASDARPKEYVRAATAIFYLCNDGWTSGDGGETALYSSAEYKGHTVEHLVPPRNNTLLAFECSPHSYHRFIANPNRRRNSIILWLHREVHDAERLWGHTINRRRP